MWMNRIDPTPLTSMAPVGASTELLLERLHQGLAYARAASRAMDPASARSAYGKAESIAEWVALQFHLRASLLSDGERKRIESGLQELGQAKLRVRSPAGSAG
jgi:hypothetical protein